MTVKRSQIPKAYPDAQMDIIEVRTVTVKRLVVLVELLKNAPVDITKTMRLASAKKWIKNQLPPNQRGRVQNNKSPQDKPNGSPGNRSSYFTNRTCQGVGSCFDGTVTKVVDGDTLDIDNVRIRLALVNTPETSQDGYSQAKRFVETNCGVGTHAIVDEDDGQKSGSYGRMIGLVFCESLIPSLNKAILISGNAQILTQYCDVSEFSGKDWARQYGC